MAMGNECARPLHENSVIWLRRLVALVFVALAFVATSAVMTAAAHAYDGPSQSSQLLVSDRTESFLAAKYERSVGTETQVSGGQRLNERGSASTFAQSNATKGGALVKYDPDFALGQVAKGGGAKTSDLANIAESQGWKRVQSPTGPIKYVDDAGVERVVLKRGSPRTPGSESPHVALRNAAGERVDPYGFRVSRRSPGSHTPIEWDLPE